MSKFKRMHLVVLDSVGIGAAPDANIQTVHGAIVNALRPFLYESTEREPIIIPMILTPDDEN